MARSSRPTSAKRITEITSTMSTAPKTRSIRKLFCEVRIQIPSPSNAPTYSA